MQSSIRFNGADKVEGASWALALLFGFGGELPGVDSRYSCLVFRYSIRFPARLLGGDRYVARAKVAGSDLDLFGPAALAGRAVSSKLWPLPVVFRRFTGAPVL